MPYPRFIIECSAVILAFNLIIQNAKASDQVTDRFGNVFSLNKEGGVSFNGRPLTMLGADNIRSVTSYENVDLIVFEHGLDQNCNIYIAATAAKNFYIPNNRYETYGACKWFEQDGNGFISKDYQNRIIKSYPIAAFSNMKDGPEFVTPFLTTDDWFNLLKLTYVVYILSDHCEKGVSGEIYRSQMKSLATKIEEDLKISKDDSHTKQIDGIFANLFKSISTDIEQNVKSSGLEPPALCQACVRTIREFFKSHFIKAPEVSLSDKKPW